MLHATYQIIKGKSNKGNDFKAIKFILKTPAGNFESRLCFPTPMEMSIIEKYSDDNTADQLKAVYSNGEISPDEGF